MIKILLLILLFCNQAYAIEVVASNDNTSLATLNDNFRQINNTANKAKELVSGYFGDDGLLTVDSGGTGQDFSTASADSLISFSDTGVMSIIDPGTSGYVLTAGHPNAWQALSGIPKYVYINKATAETGTGSSPSVNTTLSSSGDWTGKTFYFIGEGEGNIVPESGAGTCLGGTTSTNQYNAASSSAWSGLKFTSTASCTTKTVMGWGMSFTISTYSALPNGSGGCVITVVGGNLVLTAAKVFDTGFPAQITSCEFSGVIIREP